MTTTQELLKQLDSAQRARFDALVMYASEAQALMSRELATVRAYFVHFIIDDESSWSKLYAKLSSTAQVAVNDAERRESFEQRNAKQTAKAIDAMRTNASTTLHNENVKHEAKHTKDVAAIMTLVDSYARRYASHDISDAAITSTRITREQIRNALLSLIAKRDAR